MMRFLLGLVLYMLISFGIAGLWAWASVRRNDRRATERGHPWDCPDCVPYDQTPWRY